MKQINLKTTGAKNVVKKKKGSSSLALGLLLLIIVLGVYGGIFFLNKQKMTAISQTKNSINVLKVAMDKEENLKAYDFQGRLDDLEKIVDSRSVYGATLDAIAQKTREPNNFKSLSLSATAYGFKLDAALNSPNHNELALQIDAFSQIEGVKNVSLESVKRNDRGAGLVADFKMEF